MNTDILYHGITPVILAIVKYTSAANPLSILRSNFILFLMKMLRSWWSVKSEKVRHGP